MLFSPWAGIVHRDIKPANIFITGRGFAAASLRAMELLTILNRCHRFRGFVYQYAHFSADKKSIEVAVRPRKGSVAVCSRCHLRRPDSAYAHFAQAYVLRYAGLLDESAHECDTALALDRSDYRFRSCSLAFMQLGQPQRAMEFVRLDAGSEFAARQTALILLGQGKVDEARQTIQRASDTPQMGRDLLRVCLDPKQASQLDGAASRRKLLRFGSDWRLAISPEPCCRTVGKRMPPCVC